MVAGAARVGLVCATRCFASRSSWGCGVVQDTCSAHPIGGLLWPSALWGLARVWWSRIPGVPQVTVLLFLSPPIALPAGLGLRLFLGWQLSRAHISRVFWVVSHCPSWSWVHLPSLRLPLAFTQFSPRVEWHGVDMLHCGIIVWAVGHAPCIPVPAIHGSLADF